jgi:hypothetical protein
MMNEKGEPVSFYQLAIEHKPVIVAMKGDGKIHIISEDSQEFPVELPKADEE